MLYNGHKRIHAIKFQSIAAPNGMNANLYGPVKGKRHDRGMLAMSGLLPQLELHARTSNGNPLCVYGEPAYPLRVQLQGAFQRELKPATERLQSSYESSAYLSGMGFWRYSQLFCIFELQKNLKKQLSAVGKINSVCPLLTNAHKCLYKSMFFSYFSIEPPQLDEHFN